MKYLAFLVLLLSALFLGACGAQTDLLAGPGSNLGNAAGDDPLPLQPSIVELDVFSGRENPTWTLADEQTLALGELLAGLEQTDQALTRFEGLGYRGFLVQIVAPESRAVSTLYAGMGMLEVEAEGVKTTYLDPQRTVEKWLLESGKAFQDAGLYDSLSDEIQ